MYIRNYSLKLFCDIFIHGLSLQIIRVLLGNLGITRHEIENRYYFVFHAYLYIVGVCTYMYGWDVCTYVAMYCGAYNLFTSEYPHIQTRTYITCV